jgi:hypothetical protein
MKELAEDVYQTFTAKNKETNALFELPKTHTIDLLTPGYHEQFKNLSVKDFHIVLSTYKGTKAFFVQNEKEVMKEKLYSILLPFAETFIKENKEVMDTAYLEQWDRQLNVMKEAANGKLRQHITNYFEMMEAPADINVLKEHLSLIARLVK